MLRSGSDIDRLRERLTTLVRIPSVTGEEAAAIDCVADWLRATGAGVDRWTDAMATLEADPGYPGREVERDDVPVVAARIDGARPGPALLLSGHVDVVPPGDPARWSVDPFEGRADGDRVIGRGACDMKSGLVAALDAFERLAARPRDLAGSVTLLAVPGEEDGGTGTLSAIRRGLVPDAVLIAEPTSYPGGAPRAVIAHAGAITVEVSLSGRSAHACFRGDGVSAFERFLPIYEALRADEAALNDGEADPLLRALGLPYPTNIGSVVGGEWASTVMDALTAEIRVGATLDESVEDAERRVRRVVMEAAAADPWLADHPPEVRLTGGAFRGSRVSADHPAVVALRAASAPVFGAPAEPAAMPYGCDMRLWRHLAGVPAIAYGPGHARVSHTTDEWVSLTETARVAHVLHRWVGHASQEMR